MLEQLNIYFTDCYFEGNKNLYEGGGAIRYGENSDTINTKVTFNGCSFIDNHAVKGRGAISIVTK